MKKHVKNSPTLKTMLHAACLSTAMAVPSYVWAVEVGVGLDAGAKSGARTIDMRSSAGTGVVTDSRRTGVNATGTGSATGAGTGTGPGTVNSNGTMGSTGGITGNTGMGADNRPGTMGTTGITGPTGATRPGDSIGGLRTGNPGTGGPGTGSNMAPGVGQMPGPGSTPSGLDGNLNQNSQMLPDATRGLERAEDRMNTQGEASEQGTVKSKSSVKAKRNTRNRSNSTTQ